MLSLLAIDLVVHYLLLLLILKITDRYTIKKIGDAADTETASKHRKNLVRNRRYVIVFTIIALVVIRIILSICTGAVVLIPLTLVYMVLFLIMIKKSGKYTELQGNVSAYTLPEFLNDHQRFILFLRGFDSDVYDTRELGKYDFSEDLLCRVAEEAFDIPMCAVGMTREADSPEGAVRIYVEDKTWKEDVYRLMTLAEKIIIRVNDRSSCLWEICTAAEFDGKCIFVIDDLEKYVNACTALAKEGIVLPEIPDSGCDVDVMYDVRRFSFGPDRKLIDFNGELTDYNVLLGLEPDCVDEKRLRGNEKEPFYNRPFFNVLLVLAIFQILLLLFRWLLE